MVTGDFKARARVTIQQKDMRAAADLAAQAGLELPGLAANRPLWDALVDAGRGDLDHAALVLAMDPEGWAGGCARRRHGPRGGLRRRPRADRVGPAPPVPAGPPPTPRHPPPPPAP